MAGRKRPKGLVQRHHGFSVLIMVLGWLLPPLAVLIRFGVGLDFFLNIILTICGYIPGHGHNFYLQNIRNNKNAKHSPRWAIRAGLVKDYKKKPSNGWEDRYGEGAEAYDRQEITVDPLTGETRMDEDAGKRLGGRKAVKKSKFPSPWGDNPEGEDWAERHERSERRGDRESQGEDEGERDEVTGAIIGDRRGNGNNKGGLKRTESRGSVRSTASRYNYADRYGLGRNGNSSGSSFTNSTNHESPDGSSSKLKNKKEKKVKKGKKDRWEREDENGYGNGGGDNSNAWQEEERNYNGGSGNRNDGEGQKKNHKSNDPLNDGFQF